jgi:Sep-tRNA:Cys-tRNA synthetase
MNLERYSPKNLRRPSYGYINVHPIQRGGILTEEAREVLVEWADGYSICDMCVKGRVDLLKTPSVQEFKYDVAEFLGMDEARFTAGARHAKFVIMNSVAKRGDAIVVDSLAHYTTYLAAELNELKLYEVPNTGHPEYRIEPESYAQTFENVKEKTGGYPALALLTHVDYKYGNVSDVKKVGKICEEYDIPLILNTAYSSGVMPINGKKLGATFIVGSGHKNWAATAPIGVLATIQEYSEIVFRKSKIKGDITGKSFGMKETPLFGCAPVYGLPIITLMASFPGVVERVKRWDREVDKARYIVKELEKISGIHHIGIKPTQHTLNAFETPSFYEVSKSHKKRGYFLYHELKKRGVMGVQPGLTKSIKINTYGLTDDEVEKVIWAFKDVAASYGIDVED